VRVASGDVAARWLRCPRPVEQPRVHLVCFPGAGSSARSYWSWPANLPRDVEVLSVQYPGREDRIREPTIETMELLADQTAAAILTLERPVALFGHSIGAAVAYEVARRIHSNGSPRLVALIVSARPGPESQRVTSSHLKDDDALWEEVRQLGGTRDEVLNSRALRDVLLPTIRSDYKLSETYQARPGPPLDCPVVAFLGSDDAEVTVGEAQAWQRVTRGRFATRVFPGKHFYLVPQQVDVLDALSELL
jgi:pyochelin biosynthesis protein PchC